MKTLIIQLKKKALDDMRTNHKSHPHPDWWALAQALGEFYEATIGE